MNRLGQIVSVDLLLSCVIFAALLFFLYQTWLGNLQEWQRFWERTELEERAVGETGVLLGSAGFPADWTASDVNVVGLAIRPQVLNPKKLVELASMDYNTTKQKMNIGAFDFGIELVSARGSFDRNIGLLPFGNSKAVSIERKVLVGGEDAVFTFKLFK